MTHPVEVCSKSRISFRRVRASIIVLGALILCTTFLWVAGGCALRGPVCTAQFVYGITAEVIDADTGEAISPASLRLEDLDSDYEEVMMESPPGSGTFVGAGERAGRYRLIATAGGYTQRVLDEIVVNEDVCHVIPVSLDVELSAAG